MDRHSIKNTPHPSPNVQFLYLLRINLGINPPANGTGAGQRLALAPGWVANQRRKAPEISWRDGGMDGGMDGGTEGPCLLLSGCLNTETLGSISSPGREEVGLVEVAGSLLRPSPSAIPVTLG